MTLEEFFASQNPIIATLYLFQLKEAYGNLHNQTAEYVDGMSEQENENKEETIEVESYGKGTTPE